MVAAWQLRYSRSAASSVALAWKSESAKECVTTHLPNELALKMDGAQACYLYPSAGAKFMPRRVGRRGGCDEAPGVTLSRTASSADLGGSSKYSNENFED